MPNVKPLSGGARVLDIKKRKPKKPIAKGLKPAKTKPKY